MELYQYQKIHLRNLKSAFESYKVVADVSVTGAGKTIVAITTAKRQQMCKIVVIAPPTLRAQWLEYSKKESIEISFYSMYILHRLDEQAVKGAFLVVDEFHNFKNQVRRSEALKRAISASGKTLLISATPYDHPSQELWVKSLFNCSEMPSFKMEFSYDSKTSLFHLYLNQNEVQQARYKKGTQAIWSSGVIDIPQEVRCAQFGIGYKRLHDSLCAPLLRAVKHAYSASLKAKIIVGLNFEEHFEKFHREFPDALILNGSTPMRARKGIVDKFNQNDLEHRMILVSPRVGGVGIELDDKHGNYPRLVYMLPTCNAIDFYQFIGRVCRTNTRSNSKVYVAQPLKQKTYFKRQMAVKSKVLEQFNKLPTFRSAFEEHTCIATMLGKYTPLSRDIKNQIRALLCDCLK